LWVALQPFPQFGNGTYDPGNGYNAGIQVHGYPGGDSEYSSLQTKVQKRLTNHFTTLASFTWGKLFTDNDLPTLGFIGSHSGRAQDWRNLNLEHAVSAQDVKYQFTWQASYDLPAGRGRALNLSGPLDAAIGGWAVNGILFLSTGVPIASPIVGANLSYFDQRADLTCDPSRGAPHTQMVWFNSNCFAVPGTENGGNPNGNPFIPGTSPVYLDHVRTMGSNDIDLSLYKNFKFSGERNLRFEISSFNITNKAQFGYPNVPSFTSGWGAGSGFGYIGNTVNSPRQFQFGSRFTF
jgi:hypothetical protein